MDLLWRGARFQCPSGMAVHRALGVDGCCGTELDQLDDLLVQRAGMMGGFPQGLHCAKVIRVLLFETVVDVVLFLAFHPCFLALEVRWGLPH
jgi:hypothetical protein